MNVLHGVELYDMAVVDQRRREEKVQVRLSAGGCW